jgi:hypothetical protein
MASSQKPDLMASVTIDEKTTVIAEERLGVASADRRNQTHGEKPGRCERWDVNVDSYGISTPYTHSKGVSIE